MPKSVRILRLKSRVTRWEQSFAYDGARIDNDSFSFGSFGSIQNSAVNFVIGGISEDSSNYFFNGKIDDARVYNRALSDTEIKQLYNAGR
jgi:hypothetical protein